MTDITFGQVFSALIALLLAGIGWLLFHKRANHASKRSETFSMLTSAILVLDRLEETAEAHMKKIGSLKDPEDNLLHRQLFSANILAKANFFRTKVEHLEKRALYLDESKHLELRDILTMSDFDTIHEYQRLLSLTSDIRSELYSHFHNKYTL